MAVIEIDGLTKRFGDITAVDHVSFSVERGTVDGFLGANGAGKTTTLRMLLGLVAPTEGSATINGQLPRAARAAANGRRGLGVLRRLSRPHRAQPSPHPGHRRSSAPLAGRRGARSRRPHRRGRPPRRSVLAGHAPAARAGDRTVVRAPDPDPRRARQRPGPGRCPLAQSVAAPHGGRETDRLGLTPPPGGGCPDGRQRRDPRSRPPHRALHPGRADRQSSAGRARPQPPRPPPRGDIDPTSQGHRADSRTRPAEDQRRHHRADRHPRRRARNPDLRGQHRSHRPRAHLPAVDHRPEQQDGNR
jgi:energy-coupling factor transporter ATP-binding protein EcfA2